MEYYWATKPDVDGGFELLGDAYQDLMFSQIT